MKLEWRAPLVHESFQQIQLTHWKREVLTLNFKTEK